MKKLMILCLAAATSASVWAVQGTIYAKSDSKKGDIKWQARSKTYLVSFRRGNATASVEYPIADVVKLEIDKPTTYDKAVENVQRGNGGAAIAPLTKIVQDYRMLQWDNSAARWLAEAYLAANNAQKALEVATGILNDDKTAGWKGDLAPAYWKTLLKLGRTAQLEPLVKQAAQSDDRAASAAALVMRGDMILAAEGDSAEACRKALADAYLRVVLMYGDEPCREARREAMQKAAGCFDRLGQPMRAEELRSQARNV